MELRRGEGLTEEEGDFPLSSFVNWVSERESKHTFDEKAKRFISVLYSKSHLWKG